MLYVWEVIKVVYDLKENRTMRISSIVTANDIGQVWEWLAADRADERTEIESIQRFGPIVAALQEKQA